MSVVKKHVIVDDILIQQYNEKRINDLTEGKIRWEEMSEQDREKLIKIYQSKCLKDKNISFKLTYPFMKETTIDTFEIFSGTIGTRNNNSNSITTVLTNLKTNEQVFKADNDMDEVIILPININAVSSFRNLCNKWLYFKLCKIEIEYRNNSKASFVPVSCQFLPPCSERVKATVKCTNNIKLTSGTNPEHKSILNPFYIIRNLKDGQIDLDINSNDYQQRSISDTIPVSSLQDGLFVCNFDTKKYYLDYGTFFFSTMNLTNPQDILIKLKYSFKFYTHANPEDFYGKDDQDDDQNDDQDD